MPRYKIILNPHSGGGRGKRSKNTILKMVDKYRLDYSLVMTERNWHAVDLTVSAVRDGFDVVVAAGGDGTVNEVINGLMKANELGFGSAVLGVLCVGRGNDFAGGIGIPSDLDHAIEVLSQGHSRRIDIGKVFGGIHPEGRYFGNCVGIGFDAMGTIQVSKLPRLGGMLSYFIAILQTIYIYYKAPLVMIEYDKVRIQQRSLLVSVMNGHRLGGGFIMAPHAHLDDGLFDLCIASEVDKARIFSLLPHFMRGTQETQPEIKTGQAKEISIKAVEGTIPAQTDGEIICTDGSSIRITILPQKLDVVTQKHPGRESALIS